MLGIDVKRGVETTLERVYANTGKRFKRLSFAWAGRTAAVSHDGDETKIIFPGIDETKQVDRSLFNELIGYALHELGHVWFTENRPWDRARYEHGSFVSSLINGLEDPRIEQQVIKSGFAPNSGALFEYLTNAVLTKDGYVDADDFKNIPFVLAIEGRRLNGYKLAFPSVVNDAPWAEHLQWALNAAHNANDTEEIVRIAVELYQRLQKFKEEQQQPDNSKPAPSNEPPQGDPGEGEGQGQGQGDDDSQDDSDGSDGDSDGDSDDDADDDADGDSKPTKGSGKSINFDEHDGRPVEPSDYINDRISEVKANADSDNPRPHVLKPVFVTLKFN